MKINSKRIIFALLFLIVGFGIGSIIFNFGIRCDNNEFKYINKELICKDNLVVSKQSYIKLKHELESFIQEQKKANKATDVSIYFRDLQNGPTLGIKEHEFFSPASLLKLPLLLTYLSLRDEQPDILKREISIIDTDNTLKQTILPKESIEQGKTYTVEDILGRMIKYSDNKSYYALLDYLREISPKNDLLKQTFVDLGIIDPKDIIDDTISVKSYGSIFVQLYYSSYFNKKETSDEVLALLTKVDWNKGINAGVPLDVTVAHKFGERFGFSGNLVQLHDCGIVYYPENPYLLCIMTRGYDTNTLSSIIASISKMVYEEFDSRKL